MAGTAETEGMTAMSASELRRSVGGQSVAPGEGVPSSRAVASGQAVPCGERGSRGQDASAPSTPRISLVRSIHSGLAVRLVEHAGRARAAVTGEIDLAEAPMLRTLLTDCLTRSRGGLDLDLSGVTFFDCAGLNVLLLLRERAVAEGIDLTIPALGPAVARVLDITGTRGLVGAAPPARAAAAPEARVVRSARPAYWSRGPRQMP
jgi:anti-anti-sigma factor